MWQFSLDLLINSDILLIGYRNSSIMVLVESLSMDFPRLVVHHYFLQNSLQTTQLLMMDLVV
jgi:hypothetical protein